MTEIPGLPALPAARAHLDALFAALPAGLPGDGWPAIEVAARRRVRRRRLAAAATGTLAVAVLAAGLGVAASRGSVSAPDRIGPVAQPSGGLPPFRQPGTPSPTPVSGGGTVYFGPPAYPDGTTKFSGFSFGTKPFPAKLADQRVTVDAGIADAYDAATGDLSVVVAETGSSYVTVHGLQAPVGGVDVSRSKVWVVQGGPVLQEYDQKTGQQLRELALPGSCDTACVEGSTVAVNDDRVLVALPTDTGTQFATFDLTTGKPLDTSGPVPGRLVPQTAYQGAFYGAGGGTAFAYFPGGAVVTAPVAAGSTLVVAPGYGSQQLNLYAQDGKQLSRLDPLTLRTETTVADTETHPSAMPEGDDVLFTSAPCAAPSPTTACFVQRDAFTLAVRGQAFTVAVPAGGWATLFPGFDGKNFSVLTYGPDGRPAGIAWIVFGFPG